MDLYEVLGVPRNATAEDISQAYRRKAKLHHPDMHTGEDEKTKHSALFKQVSEAFETLGDLSLRARYDAGFRSSPAFTTKHQTKAKPPTKTKEDFEREKKKEEEKEHVFGTRYELEPTHVNCSFYGGDATGRSVLMHVKLTPQEMKNGCTKSVTIKKRDFCMGCGGDGFGVFICPKCKMQYRTICSHCNFTGEIESQCAACKGTGLGKWMLDEVIFKVGPGSQPGHSVTVLGAGEQASRKPPGNVRIIIL